MVLAFRLNLALAVALSGLPQFGAFCDVRLEDRWLRGLRVASDAGRKRLLIADFIAYYIVRFLAEAGVKRIWGVMGESLNGLSDSLHRLGEIRWMGTRHEEAAAFAAGAEAHITEELAVCAGSYGPGNLHLISGLFHSRLKPRKFYELPSSK